MAEINLWAAWTGILLGMASGAVQGLFFHREDWLGGYDTWPRRLTRLGHISFFGIAFLNLAYANTVWLLGPDSHVRPASLLLVAGAVLMPLVCYLAAWKKPLRHLFALPVLSLLAATVLFMTGRLA